MKSKLQKLGDELLISLDGKIDYETQEPLQEHLKKIASEQVKGDSVPLKVVFDIQQLQFVGSSGITQLIQTLKDFGIKTDQKARILNASSDFKKIIKAYDPQDLFEFIDTEAPVAKKSHRRKPMDH